MYFNTSFPQPRVASAYVRAAEQHRVLERVSHSVEIDFFFILPGPLWNIAPRRQRQGADEKWDGPELPD